MTFFVTNQLYTNFDIKKYIKKAKIFLDIFIRKVLYYMKKKRAHML